MNGVGPAWRSLAAQCLLGPDRSPLVPTILWIGWLDEDEALIAMSGTSVPASAFQGLGDGVVNTASIDCGVAGDGWSIKALALLDAASDGTILFASEFDEVQTPTEGDPLSYDAGDLAFVFMDGD